MKTRFLASLALAVGVAASNSPAVRAQTAPQGAAPAGALPPGAVGGGSGKYSPIVADPDGHYVELLQPSPLPETTAPPDSNIVDPRVRLTVADIDQTMRVYKHVLQFQPQVGQFGTIPLLDLMGLKGAQLRLTNAQ